MGEVTQKSGKHSELVGFTSKKGLQVDGRPEQANQSHTEVVCSTLNGPLSGGGGRRKRGPASQCISRKKLRLDKRQRHVCRKQAGEGGKTFRAAPSILGGCSWGFEGGTKEKRASERIAPSEHANHRKVLSRAIMHYRVLVLSDGHPSRAVLGPCRGGVEEGRGIVRETRRAREAREEKRPGLCAKQAPMTTPHPQSKLQNQLGAPMSAFVLVEFGPVLC